MNYEPKIPVLCHADPRVAALYFDKVIPLNFGSNFPEEIGWPRDILPEWLREKEGDQESFSKKYLNYLVGKWEEIFLLEAGMGKNELPVNFRVDDIVDFVGLLHNHNPIQSYPLLFRPGEEKPSCESHMSTSLLLANMPLIDVSSATWDQILEFRDDLDSTRRLRNLRTFIFEKSSKIDDVNYLEDTLLKAVEEYEETARSYNFDLVTGTTEAVLSSKLLLPSVTTAAIAAAVGQPFFATVTGALALGEMAREIGKILLKVVKNRHEARCFAGTSPISYVIEARKCLD